MTHGMIYRMTQGSFAAQLDHHSMISQHDLRQPCCCSESEQMHVTCRRDSPTSIAKNIGSKYLSINTTAVLYATASCEIDSCVFQHAHLHANTAYKQINMFAGVKGSWTNWFGIRSGSPYSSRGMLSFQQPLWTTQVAVAACCH